MFARYYGADLGRFLGVDPIVTRRANQRLPQRWNRYIYSLNSPLNFLDPNGETVQVAVGGPTNTNAFGHISIIVNNTVYSYGTAYSGGKDWGVSRDAYFNKKGETGKSQNDVRQTRILTLKATPEQEAALEKGLKDNNPNDGEYSVLNHSCVTVTENALQDAGILANEPGPVTTDPAGNELQAGAEKSFTPEGLEDQIEDQDLVEEEATEGTPATDPKTKTGIVMDRVKESS
jgi:hypothetical protein